MKNKLGIKFASGEFVKEANERRRSRRGQAFVLVAGGGESVLWKLVHIPSINVGHAMTELQWPWHFPIHKWISGVDIYDFRSPLSFGGAKREGLVFAVPPKTISWNRVSEKVCGRVDGCIQVRTKKKATQRM